MGLGGASKYVRGGGEEDTTVTPLGPWRVRNSEAVGGTGDAGLREGGGHGATEEGMLQCIVWLYPRVRVIVQHAEDEIFELAIVTGGVAGFPLANSPWPPSLLPQYVIQ